MKKTISIIFIFLIGIVGGILLNNLFNNINKEKLLPINISKENLKIDEVNFGKLFKDIEINKNEKFIYKELCSIDKNYKSLLKFKSNNEVFFKKVFLGFNGKEYLSDSGNKSGLYFYDNCDFLDKNTGIYGECIINKNRRIIFNNEKGVIKQFEYFPFNFNYIDDIVKNKECNKLIKIVGFKSYVKYCEDSSMFSKKLDNISFELINTLCQK